MKHKWNKNEANFWNLSSMFWDENPQNYACFIILGIFLAFWCTHFLLRGVGHPKSLKHQVVDVVATCQDDKNQA